MLNRFQTAQNHCGSCKKKRNQAATGRVVFDGGGLTAVGGWLEVEWGGVWEGGVPPPRPTRGSAIEILLP